MAILSRQAIAGCLAAGQLQIEPLPREEDFDSDAVDVHLGETIYEWVPPARGLTFSRVEAPVPLRPRSAGQFDDQQSARGRASDAP